VRQDAIDQRLLQMRKDEELRQKEDELLRRLDERFNEFDPRLDAIVSSSATNSSPQPPTHASSD
jgi:hypothetical protein